MVARAVSSRTNLLHSLRKGHVRTAVTMGQRVPEDKNLRRPLTFGGLLDETIQIFRRHWLSFLALGAAALIPSGLFLVAIQLQAPSVLLGSGVVRPTGPGVTPAAVLGPALGVGLLVGVVNSLFTLIWALAVTVQTSALLAGEPMSFGQVYRHALARFLPTACAPLLILLAAIPLLIASGLLVVLTLGPIGMLAALIPARLLELLLTLVLSNVSASPAAAALTNLGSVVGQMLFGAIAYIAYVLLFIDLRNRREGADLAARVEGLERQTSLSPEVSQ